MKKILIENIHDGLILARDICGPNDNVLLGKGTTLTQSLGRRLKNWGVSFVWIEGEEEKKVESVRDESIAPDDILKHLEEKFSLVKENPLMRELFDAVRDFRTKVKRH
jgi:hypothetical protein